MKKKLGQSKLMAAFLGSVALSGCGFRDASLVLERSRLELELKSLQQIETQLSNPDFNLDSSQIAIKLGYEIIDEVLAGADGFEVPLGRDGEGVLRFDEIRVRPADGTPLLSVKASAIRGTTRLEVAVTSMLIIDYQEGGGVPSLRVRVTDIEPVFSLTPLKFARLSLASTVASVKADEVAINRLVFPIPVEQELALVLAGLNETRRETTVSDTRSWVDLNFARPSSTISHQIRVDWVFFLRDGLHIHASLS